jgi:hypothetical protein
MPIRTRIFLGLTFGTTAAGSIWASSLPGRAWIQFLPFLVALFLSDSLTAKFEPMPYNFVARSEVNTQLESATI